MSAAVTSPQRTIRLLNRLLGIEYRSLPMYLTYASPWTHEGDEKATEALRHIVADQEAMSQRIAELVQSLGGRPEPGEYPMDFTSMHFLSLDFLLTELVRHQQRSIAAIERVVGQLGDDREARELAEELLGSERAHLEALESLPTS